ncbi:hypothetical protein EIP86_008276 [Pleurotus ostreatoroseus]|nr:hypothetical protein EIP86_008276 [Pleurotus ostreatoroseus]
MQVEPKVPREIQEMVIDENKNDTVTLASSCLVNHAWYYRAHSHLFSRLCIRATLCAPSQVNINAADEFEETDIPEALNPTFSFKKALEILPYTFGGTVKHLVLTSASSTTRMKNAAQGIRLFRPELTACLVKAFIERFSELESLTIEDVEWENCTQTQGHCDCIETMDRRGFTSLILRNVWHHSVQMNVTYVAQCAREIRELVMEGLRYEESERPLYKKLVVDSFTLGTASCHQAVVVPDMQIGSLRTINITAMSYMDIKLVKALLERHGNFVHSLEMSVVVLSHRPSMWNDIGLRQCMVLRNFTLKCAIHPKDVEHNCAAQNMLLKIVAQLPRSNLTALTLVFDTVLDATATPETLLTSGNWERLAMQTESFHELEQITISVTIPSNAVHEGQQKVAEFTKGIEDTIRGKIVESTSTKIEEYDDDEL